MAGCILQVNFKYGVSRAQYEQAVSELAPLFAQVPGLRWKIWILNENESEAGGICYFEDSGALETYLSGELADEVTSHPALSEMSVKQFDVLEDLTSITRGPV